MVSGPEMFENTSFTLLVMVIKDQKTVLNENLSEIGSKFRKYVLSK